MGLGYLGGKMDWMVYCKINIMLIIAIYDDVQKYMQSFETNYYYLISIIVYAFWKPQADWKYLSLTNL